MIGILADNQRVTTDVCLHLSNPPSLTLSVMLNSPNDQNGALSVNAFEVRQAWEVLRMGQRLVEIDDCVEGRVPTGNGSERRDEFVIEV